MTSRTPNKKLNKVKIIMVLVLLFSMTYILSACTKQTATPAQNQNRLTTQISAEDKIKEVLKQFENQKIQPDLVIDAGNLKKSKPSTVIDLTDKKIKILRKGEITIK